MKRGDLETRFSNLESDYEELLDKTIAMEEAETKQTTLAAESITELKSKLEHQYALKRDMQQKELDALRHDMDKKRQEEAKLEQRMKDLQAEHDRLVSSKHSTALEQKERDLERMRKSMAQELSDFDTMKKVLMRDLQARCEKVVELEITLEETKLQQTNLIKATSNKAQQKKMALLERNLDQLTQVQKQVKGDLSVNLFIAHFLLLVGGAKFKFKERVCHLGKKIAGKARFHCQFGILVD